MDDSVMKNNIFIEFFEELKSKITEDRFANVVWELGITANPKDYYRAFLTSCLNDCKAVKYKSFTEQQQGFLNRSLGRHMWPIIKRVLPDKFKKPEKVTVIESEAIEESLRAAGI